MAICRMCSFARGGDQVARRKKKLEYFPLDSDFFSDKKIKVVLARYGADGVTLYLYILCEIYKNSYYISADDDFYYVASADLNMSSDKVKQVLNFLLKRSLFDDKLFQSDKVLTSTGIQEQYQESVKERAKKNPVTVEKYWLLKEEETQPYIKVIHQSDLSHETGRNSRENASNSRENSIKESKGKKSREKERKEKKPAPQIDPNFGEVISFFESCGFKINGYTSEELSSLIEEFSQDWVLRAIRRAADMNKLTIGYVKGILNNWQTSGGMDQPKQGVNWDDV